MLKSEIEQQNRELQESGRKQASTIYNMQLVAKKLEQALANAEGGVQYKDRSLAKVREAIEAIVATRWPEVDLNVTAYEVSMNISMVHPGNMHPREYANEWNERNAAPKQENPELSLLRHLHKLAS